MGLMGNAKDNIRQTSVRTLASRYYGEPLLLSELKNLGLNKISNFLKIVYDICGVH